jgi:hypothetical protein
MGLRHFQALIITCDEIFQVLAVEGHVPLPKTLLDLGFDGVVVRWKSPASEIFFPFAKNVEVGGRGGIGPVLWVGGGPGRASGAGSVLPPGLGKSRLTL